MEGETIVLLVALLGIGAVTSYHRLGKHALEFTGALVLVWLAVITGGSVLVAYALFLWLAVDWERLTQQHQMRESTLFLAAATTCLVLVIVTAVYAEYAGLTFALAATVPAVHLFVDAHLEEKRAKQK